MRQAGRYLPEYLEVRKNIKSFLDLCYDPQKAAQVTLQPIERFNMDAAIVFSDILVTADSLGIKVDFQEKIGPVLEKISDISELEKITPQEDCLQFKQVAQTIKIVKKAIPDKHLIGFIGGSWTVCAYILEGIGKTQFTNAIEKIYTDYSLVEKLIEIITIQNIYSLKAQIEAGASIVQIFESHTGIVPEQYREKLILEPTQKICHEIKKIYPEVKIIGFPRNGGYFYDKLIAETQIDIIGCDQYISLDKMKEWQKSKIVQGNLDPLVLLSNKEKIKEKAENILNHLDNNRLIFNLGHGVLPQTKPENVQFLVDLVKAWNQKK